MCCVATSGGGVKGGLLVQFKDVAIGSRCLVDDAPIAKIKLPSDLNFAEAMAFTVACTVVCLNRIIIIKNVANVVQFVQSCCLFDAVTSSTTSITSTTTSASCWKNGLSGRVAADEASHERKKRLMDGAVTGAIEVESGL